MADGLIPGVSSGPDAIHVGNRKVPIALLGALAAIGSVILLIRHRGAASSTATGYSPTGSQLQGLEDQINTLQQQFGGLQGTVATLGATSSATSGGLGQMPPGAPAPVAPTRAPAPAPSPNGDAFATPVSGGVIQPAGIPRPKPHPVPWQRSGPAPVAPDMADRTPPIQFTIPRPAPRVQPLPGQRTPLPVTIAGSNETVRRPGRPY